MNNINSINNILANNINSANRTSTNNINTNQFALLLNSMLNNSAASIGSFSDTSNNSLSSGGNLFGLGGSNSLGGLDLLRSGSGIGSLGGLGALTGAQDNSSDNIIMMLLMLLLQKEGVTGNNGSSGNALLNNNLNTANCNHQFASANNLFGNTTNTLQTQTQNGSIPAASQVASNPSLTNIQGERHPQTYRAVMDQFDVENNERYRVNKQGKNDTYCNIFMWDVTRAMGAEIPHYVDTQTNEPAYYPNIQNAKEMDANSTNDWLNEYGGNYGWRKVSAQEAQAYANMGMPAVTSWENSNGHGHLQMVSPSENGAYDPVRGVAIAQAGSDLYNYSYISKVYGDGRLNEVDYFVHI